MASFMMKDQLQNHYRRMVVSVDIIASINFKMIFYINRYVFILFQKVLYPQIQILISKIVIISGRPQLYAETGD